MKLNAKMLALMAAMAAGVAGAAPTATVDRTGNLTNAGTPITNTATANFDNPDTTDTANPTLKSDSNTVTTTVAPKMAFDITYPNGADADATDTPAGAADNIATGVKPGSTVVFPYVAVNNGNDTQTISLTSATATGATGVVFYKQNPDTNNDGILDSNDTAIPNNTINDVTVLPSDATHTGMVTFYMSYVATGASGGQTGATPIGTGLAWDGTANVSTTEQKDAGAAGTPTYDDLWYQYSQVNFIKTGLNNTPDTTPTDNSTTTVVPPTTGTTPDPTNPVTPPGTPTTPTDPTKPGYQDPTDPNTAIEIKGNEQIAYPPADANTTDDSVTFINTIKNTGDAVDTVTLSIIPRDNLPTGYTQVVTPTGTPGQYTVEQKNPDGTTTTATVTLSTTTVTVNPNGGVQDYQVTVTYPDNDNGTPYPIYVAIGADSGNDADNLPDVGATTYDTIMPPAMKFGDTTSVLGGDPALVGPGNTAQVVSVKPTDGTGSATSTATNDRTASFPMDIANTGQYNDSYTLSATTTVPGATVKYYDSTGALLPEIKDAGGNVIGYMTPVVTPGQEIKVYAVVDVPVGTPANTYTVDQKATANYSGIVLTDTTKDEIKVGAVGEVVVGKFIQDATVAGTEYTSGAVTCTATAPTDMTTVVSSNPGYTCQNTTKYVPGQQYSYQITGKNNYNTAISGFNLTDDLSGKPFNTVLDTDITCSDGGTPSITNNVAKCSYPDTVATGKTRTMTIKVTIK